jgi:YD repeat-containing protein
MKNIKNLWLPIFVGALLLNVACDKENEQNVLLTKVTWSNSRQSGEIVYEYDNQNRLVTITEESNSNIYLSKISYNSSGNVSERIRSQNGVENSRTVYTYPNNKITVAFQNKVGDQWIENTKTEYTKDASGQITKMQSFFKVDGDYQSDSYQLQLWENGNIVKQETWNSKDGIMMNSNVLEFDDKYNPYVNHGILNGLNGFYRNNRTNSMTFNEANEEIYSYTNSYEYNDSNYPSKIWESKHNNEDVVDPTVQLLEYTIN